MEPSLQPPHEANGYTSAENSQIPAQSTPHDPAPNSPLDDTEMASFLEGAIGDGVDNGEKVDINALNTLNERALDIGEKADDAIDYEDIGDDDLADEEMDDAPAQISADAQILSGIEAAATDDLMADDDDGDDDLFGDNDEDEPGFGIPQPNGVMSPSQEDLSPITALPAEAEPVFLTSEERQLWEEQQMLFKQVGEKRPETMRENDIQHLRQYLPDYDPHKPPKWTKWMAPKPRGPYGKKPLKPPKTIKPTKVALDLGVDQKTHFNSTLVPSKKLWESEFGHLIHIDEGRAKEQQIDEDLESEIDPDEELPGGVTMQDLNVLCADFDTLSDVVEQTPETEEVPVRIRVPEDDDELFGLDDFESSQPVKKRKLGMDPHDIVSLHHFDVPSFDDPESMTLEIAKRAVLDMNDQHLLLEELQPETLQAQAAERKAPKTVKEKLLERFNYSNDAEYDMLKQNHQNKVRSTLGNLSVEHSTPAIKLQFPYYQVKLSTQEARAWHRKQMTFSRYLPFNLSKPRHVKKKHLKGKTFKDVYYTTDNLGLGDNSTAMLLEYSEEHPMIMSETGMGSRIINYYRRKDQDDHERPKLAVGETHVLLPEDKSPFHRFGHIDSGETVSALYNSMYRAPVFSHEPKSHDFLLLKAQTGIGGTHYYLRNVDHIYTVGQEFPSVEVPGPHSRKVTTAAKNRLKMISFRIIRRKKSNRLRVEDVTRHFPDTTDMQNRQKMKEFLKFSKEYKEWEMKPGEPIPEEDLIQSLIRPEDVCLLESMQVGQQYLQDAGVQDDSGSEDENDDKDKEQVLEKQLAPWNTSKNFQQAAAHKAMIAVFGKGDPSGRGEAFSMIKTSMKGGFKAQGESVADKMEAQKELGGHGYNVARQDREYQQALRDVWNRQRAALSSAFEPSDTEEEEEEDDDDEMGVDNAGAYRDKPTPRSEVPTPAAWRDSRDEDMMSHISSVSQNARKVLRIKRRVKKGGEVQIKEEVITDINVIKQYVKRKHQLEIANTAISDLTFTGNEELDARNKKRLLAWNAIKNAAELASLQEVSPLLDLLTQQDPPPQSMVVPEEQ
ncbi:MAG: hypothetical protein Q9227_007834 [Pyrenula ochraceoflavens]